MQKLSTDALALLEALTEQAARAAGGAEPTLDALSLAQRIDPAARAPYRNRQAVTDALSWCRAQSLPLLPLMVVIDKAYPQPESTTLAAAWGALPRAEAQAKWQAELDAIRALAPQRLADARAALTAAHKPATPATRPPRTPRKTAAAPRTARSSAPRAASSSAPKPAAPGRSSVRVRMASIDAQAFGRYFEAYQELVCDMAPNEPLFNNSFLHEQEGDPAAAWAAWDAQLGVAQWGMEMVGSGLVAEAVQATVDSPQAVWLTRSDDAKNISSLARRGAHHMDGLALLEGALVRFYTCEMEAPEFLSVLRDLFGRHYALISHLLFLRDDNEFTPVTPRTAEEGLHRLGVEAALSGYCTWEGYSRLLEHLDRIRELCATAGEQRPTRPQAQQFLQLCGAGYLD